MTTKIPVELSSTPGIVDSSNATAITIDSSERVGIGTSSPSVPLDIVTTLSSDTTTSPDTVLTIGTTYASTGANGGAGAGPRLEFKIPDDETNPITGAAIAGLKEDANDSVAHAALAFYTSQDDTTLDEAMRINSSGNVGIGSTNPAGLLTIAGSGDAIRIESSNSGAGGAQMDMLHFSASPADEDVHGVINFGGYYSGSSSSYGSTFKSVWSDVSAQQARLEFWTRNGSDYLQRFRIDHLGQLFAFTLTGSSASNPTLKINTSSGFIYYDSSTLRYKENVQDFPSALDKVKALRPVTYDDKVLQVSSFGLVAEEVNEIAPELVTYKEIDGEEKPETVVYDKLTIHLLKAIQEQQTQIEALQAEINTLKGG